MCAPEACTSFLPVQFSGLSNHFFALLITDPGRIFLDFERFLWILVPSNKLT